MAKFLDYDGLLYFWSKIKSTFVSKVSGKDLSTNDYTTTEKNKLAGLSNYTLPTASNTTKGGIKVGAGLTMDGEVLSATGGGTADSVAWDNVVGKPETFAPSTHTHDIYVPTTRTVNSKPLSANITLSATDVGAAPSSHTHTASSITDLTATIATAITAAGHLKREVVAELPAVGSADANTVYMVPISGASGENCYTEWMVVNGAFEKTGDGTVDLTGYWAKVDLVAITNAEIDAIVAA